MDLCRMTLRHPGTKSFVNTLFDNFHNNGLVNMAGMTRHCFHGSPVSPTFRRVTSSFGDMLKILFTYHCYLALWLSYGTEWRLHSRPSARSCWVMSGANRTIALIPVISLTEHTLNICRMDVNLDCLQFTFMCNALL